MSPCNLWVNKSIAPKHLSQLQQLLETSFWNQTPRQEPGPGCECRKVRDTAQQRAKRQKKNGLTIPAMLTSSRHRTGKNVEWPKKKKKEHFQFICRGDQRKYRGDLQRSTNSSAHDEEQKCLYSAPARRLEELSARLAERWYTRLGDEGVRMSCCSFHPISFQRPLRRATHSGKQDSPLTSLFQQNAVGNFRQLTGRNRNTLTRSRLVFEPEVGTASS